MTTLDQHGTKLMALKPASIVAAARADLARREDNRGTVHKPPGREHYAFHRLHVRKAVTANDLLAVAQRDRSRGLTSPTWRRASVRSSGSGPSAAGKRPSPNPQRKTTRNGSDRISRMGETTTPSAR